MADDKNDLNLGEVKVDDEYVRVNDVLMPLWTENNGYTFITNFRKVLESEECSENIHQWFELIFGKNQKRENKIIYENAKVEAFHKQALQSKF